MSHGRVIYNEGDRVIVIRPSTHEYYNRVGTVRKAPDSNGDMKVEFDHKKGKQYNINEWEVEHYE